MKKILAQHRVMRAGPRLSVSPQTTGNDKELSDSGRWLVFGWFVIWV